MDADPVGRDGSGNETYLRGVIGGLQAAMAPTDELILFGGQPDALHEILGPTGSVVALRPGLVGELTLGRLARRARADVFVAHYNPPLAFGGPVATVIHDVSFRRTPEAYPRLLRGRIALTVRRAARVSALVVTGSEFSRGELLMLYRRLSPERVIVTPYADRPGAVTGASHTALAEVRARHNLPDRFVLAVGNLQPRKNLGRLSQATASLDVPLVVVGQPRWRADEVRRQAGYGSVTWLGYVSDDDLRHLYRLCTVFAYPSLYEGFGLPVVEAMACGAPVVTSNVSALPEVAGEAAVLVDPYSPEDIAAGIGRLLESPDLRADYARRGRVRAGQFSWKESAATLLRALRTLS